MVQSTVKQATALATGRVIILVRKSNGVLTIKTL